ncbi:glycosyltransferase family 2 protein [Geomonas nitrogeniifigens]|uniref:Glycosyltransferase family 2 protein n=1 Tax=Geomonas diazotrophica TaxID=2843197 RepID=A0ABX8JKZ1_9BACT|nr:glycosyltransferase family A protein [Geomonas nitrogeniifigens]QWV99040.1 glycosyltransferase family 2 protein [Geomonas nitrogeniifigens]QXE88206.1 glycosyltransferase family 2 protein [Geomonas nitrogeniifigens]
MIGSSHSPQPDGSGPFQAPDDWSVDVVIPVYNGAPYIERALRSVLEQDHPPTRIIVVDDGSTDATADIVRGVRGEVPIRYFHQENGGLSSARNAGIRLCSSRFVAFLDADDEWYPDKLSRQLALFRESSFPHLAAVYCRYDIIDEGSVVRHDCHVVEPDPENRGDIFQRILAANLVTGSGSGILVLREALGEVGFFDETLSACEDWDMWLRLARRYQFDYVDGKLVKIRRHGSNMQKDDTRMFVNSLTFYNKWSEEAFRAGHHRAWSNAVVCRIAQELPRLDSLRLTRSLLEPQARRFLFNATGGSLPLFLLLRTPTVLIIVLKRMLGLKP